MKFHFSRKQLCIPYAVFLVCFVLIPMFIIVFYAFTAPVMENGVQVGITFSFDNLVDLFTNPTKLLNMGRSILIGLLTTVICLLIAYPVAYILARSGIRRNAVLLLLFIVPMWVNFVLRVNALKELLSWIGILGASDFWNYFNTVLGMVYDFLPFMILPLYTTLLKIDNSYVEAAKDLGASAPVAFWKVTLPLSYPGIVSGITMVFLPSMTNYVVSTLLGNGKVGIIGSLIEQSFLNSQWNAGSMMALLLLVVMFVSTWLTGGFQNEDAASSRGGNLW
ncbi:MAG: ABC transporter permease [Clostridia bacterium]|nr:ABC transporter permease [Clostridia bacterium]